MGSSGKVCCFHCRPPPSSLREQFVRASKKLTKIYFSEDKWPCLCFMQAACSEKLANVMLYISYKFKLSRLFVFMNILFDKKTQYAIFFKMQLVSYLPHCREIWMY